MPDRSTFSDNRHGHFADGDLMHRLFESVFEKCVGFGLGRNGSGLGRPIPTKHNIW
ncbi:hypothetical protein [Roseobacter weihaiensis]|uniref:hypothetical protein n=1 Tax=Roseobacter weihaiensis TaxID=2763262 RepID=UPI003873596B